MVQFILLIDFFAQKNLNGYFYFIELVGLAVLIVSRASYAFDLYGFMWFVFFSYTPKSNTKFKRRATNNEID